MVWDTRLLMGRLDDLAISLDKAGEDVSSYPLRELQLLPPITAPDKIICIGLNYSGDQVKVIIEQVGELVNPIVAAKDEEYIF